MTAKPKALKAIFNAASSLKRLTLKRAFDIAASAAGLVVVSLPVVFAAAVLAYDTRSIPFFRQQRVGKGGTPFTILKLKTMRDVFDKSGKPLPEEQRTSRLGELVRKSRLDELPQLLNILKGDMSLVGPRPVQQFEYISQDKTRQSVTPGLTGLTQVSGNNNLSLEKVLEYDLSYIQRQKEHGAIGNFIYDLALIAATPFSLIINRKAPHFRK